MKAIPTGYQKVLAIATPFIALLICIAGIYPRQKHLVEVNNETHKANADIRKYLAQLKAISDLPPEPQVATQPLSKQEQSDFLRGLSLLCARTGNRIVTISSLAAPLQTAATAPAPNAKPTEAPLPADVLEIKSTVTFEGNFQSIRAFLHGMHMSRRLVSLSDCRIGPAQQGFPMLQASVTISRYVDNPNPVPSTPATPPDATKTASISGVPHT